MDNKRRIKMILAGMITLAALILAIYIYIFQLNDTVSKSTIFNMEELSRHDVESIENYLYTSWRELRNIAERFEFYDCETVEALQERMNLERITSDFSAIYLLDEDGNLYSDDYETTAPGGHNLGQYFAGGAGYFVVRHNEGKDGTAHRQDALYYGIRLDNFEIDGIRFTGIVGKCELESIQGKLRQENFNGRGYSSVVDSRGNFIVNIDKSISASTRQNFFDSLKEGTMEDGESAEEIRQKMIDEEQFLMRYKRPDGESMIMVFIPVQQVDWYFIMEVPQSVFDEQNRNFITMTMVMLIFVVIIIMVMILFVYKAIRNATRARLQAEIKSDFLSNMSHEIRTPLNGIIGLNHLMKTHMDEHDRMKEYLKKSEHTAQYLLSLINDILDMSKLQTGGAELFKEPFSLNDLLEDIRSMQSSNIESRGLELIVEKEIMENHIVGDEVRLKQVLMNILSNAAKFTPAGGTITVRFKQEGMDDGRVMNCFEIEDTGCGMSEEFQQHIFESFTQERNKVEDSQKGTGLGMSISYLLMQQMGGELSVVSELGKGSIFTAVFPAEVAKQDSAALAEEKVFAAMEVQHREKPLNILLAEDNELNAEILLEILKENGFTVSHAGNGEKVVEMFRDSEPGEFDIILMDVQMPKMNGYEAASTIRRLDRPDAKTITIFACTANTMKEDRDRAMDSGMDDFLVKPIDVSALIKKLGIQSPQEQ